MLVVIFPNVHSNKNKPIKILKIICVYIYELE